MLAETGCTLVDDTIPENRIWSILFNVVGFGLSPFVFLIESNFSYFGQARTRYWIYLPALIHLCLACTSPFTGWIFYVDENCAYSRGPLFFLYAGVFAFSVLIAMVGHIKAVQNYPRYFRSRIWSTTLLMLLGLTVQLIQPEYTVSWMIISVYLVLYYALSCEMSGMLDGLTGLLNRAAFDSITYRFKDQKNKAYCLIALDVNNFKLINDTQGHTYGDNCLRQIAAILMQVFLDSAYVFRLGGDEFCVLIPAQPGQNIDAFLDKVNKHVAEKQKGNQPFPELAAGYAMLGNGKELYETINQADAMMYRNKQKMKIR